jgi:hypothetical protein
VIAWRETRSPAISLAGPDCDRAVDETGGQIAASAHRLAPFTREEQLKFLPAPDGSVWTVSDTASLAPGCGRRPTSPWHRATQEGGGPMRHSWPWGSRAAPERGRDAAAAALPRQARSTWAWVNCASQPLPRLPSASGASNVLQNEYVTGRRVDKARARVPGPAQRQEQAHRENLGLKEPAHEAKICVDCHGHNPPAASRGERFKASDGIGCEACHGPAEKWIASHVAPGATHEDNVRNGLYPTSDPVALARLCLSCHFGNKDKFVSHRIMGAGHPRLSFELDTFTQTQPPHFVVDEDWQKRKGRFDGVRVWAIGQALAAQESLDVVLDPKRGRDGLFPELVVFDCHACHHPMSETRWKPRVGTRRHPVQREPPDAAPDRERTRRTRLFSDLVLQLQTVRAA